MIRTLLLDTEGQVEVGDERLIERWSEMSDCHIWIDLQGESVASERAMLEAFGCHPMAIDDAHRERHPPKIEEFDTHTLILYRGISSFDSDLNFVPQQMAFFVGERFLISLHPGTAMSIDRLLAGDGKTLLRRSPEHVALKIMYVSAGFYIDSLLEFENQLSDIEDELLEDGSDALMRRVIGYRSRLVKMRRVFSYHVGITQELTAYDYSHLPRGNDDTLHAINDVHERFDRLLTLTQMYYDICGDLVDGHISLASHQLNITMRVLTVITAIFVPLTFLAGIYGMNFQHMPELAYRYGYFVLLVMMLLIGLGLLWVFRRKKWL
ncbi:magnesium transporter CorA family protein [Halomonas urumqiensis]|uniref:Metal transporter n=1 Tax=Halomonas urumqiensis TaxID=1684789 RepID=A0A2N7UMQ2_9GAMM|nr:magnesium transporter CorA family protein [Halomonas urumqiensis]PMR81707.1 metal transporter [Halomonas urumqiensis]PTB02344.1 metal transporter [Halomonas urumqiensis]GHE21820.1 putative metal ion transporter YfjQ [Halomonas urumqiensis]